jgi:hypothetical protein
MRRFAALLFTAVASVAAPTGGAQAPAPATAHTDFSGTWNLDVTKLDPQVAAAGITSGKLVITQDAKTMKQEQSISSSAMGSQNVTVNYNLDGSDSKNSVSQGGMTMDMTSTTSWDGPVLVVNTKASIQGQELQRTERYSLDSTGKVLTIDTSMSVMGQSMALKQSFNKA